MGGGGGEPSSCGGKRAASVSAEAPEFVLKERKDRNDGPIAPVSASTPITLTPPQPASQELGGDTDTAKRILRGAVQRTAIGSLPLISPWMSEFWQSLNVRAGPVASALLDRAVLALTAWIKAAEAAGVKSGTPRGVGTSHLSDAVDVVVAVAALHPPHDDKHLRLQQMLDALDRQLAPQNAAVDFCAACGRIRDIKAAYTALLNQVESIGIREQETQLGDGSAIADRLAMMDREVNERQAASTTNLKGAKDELEAARHAFIAQEAVMASLEHDRADTAVLELEVSEDHAKAIARVDVRHSTAYPVAVSKQQALEAEKEAVQRCELAVTAATEALAFDVMVSALLSNVERQWIQRNKAMRQLAVSFVNQNFPALCKSLHTFLVKGNALHRESVAEVVRLEDERSRDEALNELEPPSEELAAIQRHKDQELERCKYNRNVFHRPLVTEVREQRVIWRRSLQMLPPKGFHFVAQQYRQLVERCAADDVKEWLQDLVEDVKSNWQEEDEEKKEDEEVKREENVANSSGGTCVFM